jgi:NADH:ubiquinone oxidoreductase subunit 4 (subunit M)
VVPLFPDAAHPFAPMAMILAVIGLLYGGVLAFGQTDFKRLVAYTGVSHLACCSGIFAWDSCGVPRVRETAGANVNENAHSTRRRHKNGTDCRECAVNA